MNQMSALVLAPVSTLLGVEGGDARLVERLHVVIVDILPRLLWAFHTMVPSNESQLVSPPHA
jgi:hypothetical protein